MVPWALCGFVLEPAHSLRVSGAVNAITLVGGIALTADTGLRRQESRCDKDQSSPHPRMPAPGQSLLVQSILYLWMHAGNRHGWAPSIGRGHAGKPTTSPTKCERCMELCRESGPLSRPEPSRCGTQPEVTSRHTVSGDESLADTLGSGGRRADQRKAAIPCSDRSWGGSHRSGIGRTPGGALLVKPGPLLDQAAGPPGGWCGRPRLGRHLVQRSAPQSYVKPCDAGLAPSTGWNPPTDGAAQNRCSRTRLQEPHQQRR